MSAFDGRALLLLAAIVAAVVFLPRLIDSSGRSVERHVARALDRPAPTRIARVVFVCHLCRHVVQETAANLDDYLTALETGECNACRAVIETHEKEWTA